VALVLKLNIYRFKYVIIDFQFDGVEKQYDFIEIIFARYENGFEIYQNGLIFVKIKFNAYDFIFAIDDCKLDSTAGGLVFDDSKKVFCFVNR